MIATQAMRLVTGIALEAGEVFGEKSILVLELITERGFGPTARREFSLVLEPGAVQVFFIDEWAINEEVEAVAVADGVNSKATMVIVITAEPVLPARAGSKRKVCATQQYVAARSLIHVGRQQWCAIEV